MLLKPDEMRQNKQCPRCLGRVAEMRQKAAVLGRIGGSQKSARKIVAARERWVKRKSISVAYTMA
jgi:hypothetical protein